MKTLKHLYSRMIELAVHYHNGQYDKGDNPYILHPFAVMNLLGSDDIELNMIAIGHDLIEDTKISYKKLEDNSFQYSSSFGYEVLIKEGFSKRVVNRIACMTKECNETYTAYKEKVKSNYDSILVKKADLIHNSDIRRLKGVTEKDINRIARYHKFFLELEATEREIFNRWK